MLGLLIIGWQVSALLGRGQPEDIIYHIYRQVYRGSRKLVPPASLHETPSAFASRLSVGFGRFRQDGFFARLLAPAQQELGALTDLYLQALYSPRRLTVRQGKLALRTWKRFYWRLLLARLVH